MSICVEIEGVASRPLERQFCSARTRRIDLVSCMRREDPTFAILFVNQLLLCMSFGCQFPITMLSQKLLSQSCAHLAFFLEEDQYDEQCHKERKANTDPNPGQDSRRI